MPNTDFTEETDIYRSISSINAVSKFSDGSLASALTDAIADLSVSFRDKSRSVSVTQNNYSPKALSALETEKAARELAQKITN